MKWDVLSWQCATGENAHRATDALRIGSFGAILDIGRAEWLGEQIGKRMERARRRKQLKRLRARLLKLEPERMSEADAAKLNTLINLMSEGINNAAAELLSKYGG